MKQQDSETMDDRIALSVKEWQKLEYGMFIHFGMSTFTGREIDPGDRPSSTYAPTQLDVDQWIRVAHDAGMKYAVLTSKHVAGHCLWDSKVQWKGKEFDYDVATSSNRTDVVAEFVKACGKYNLKAGLYYCLMDGPNGHGHTTWSASELKPEFFHLVQAHLKELLGRYPGIFYLWIDIPRVASMEQRTTIYQFIKNIAPGCVVLFNHGCELPSPMSIEKFQAAWPTDILNSERNVAKPGAFSGVQTLNAKTYQLGYEHCDTICKNWFSVAGDNPRPAEELYTLYRSVRQAPGNFLLNVPPDRTGRIPDCHVQRLMELRKRIDTVSPIKTTAQPSARGDGRPAPQP